jgi:hypothetical protein
MFTFTKVLNFFTNELTSLGCRRFTFGRILAGAA